eukprot:gb/GEZN01001851.1/.p1 GENE.gb/GEZN01001851.1/~~gb/GEZN01001851.1/.p1  ORF type:complete len:728 (-),score=106.33 gb/GEZN01001851.1/:464-2647(-)
MSRASPPKSALPLDRYARFDGEKEEHAATVASEERMTFHQTEEAALVGRSSRWSLCSRSKERFCLLIFVLAFVALAVLSIVQWLRLRDLQSSSLASPLTTSTQCASTAQQALGTNGAVASTHYLASEAGLAVLQAGGNAFDAAAVMQWMLSVVQPHSTGIAGGCVIVFYHAETNTTHALDGREEAPGRFTPGAFCKDPACQTDAQCTCEGGAWPFGERSTGGHSVGVPGVVRAVERLLQDYGSMSFAQTLQPAIRVAKEGWPMYKEMHDRLTSNQDRLVKFEASRALFLPNNSQPLAVAQMQYNPDIAVTLELLASQGPDAFYTGEIGLSILEAVRSQVNPVTNLTGVMDLADLAAYRAVYRQATSTNYRNYQVVGHGLPTSGGVVTALALNLLENYQVGGMQKDKAEFLHRFLDVQDASFADRNKYLGDADWVDIPLEGLMDKGYASTRAKEIFKTLQSARSVSGAAAVSAGNPPGLSNAHQFASAPDTPKSGTTHFSVVDKDRNVIAFTTTIEENFGSAVVVPGRGFLLNNELTDFTSTPRDDNGVPFANAPAGGKLPRRTALDRPADGQNIPDSRSLGGKRPMSSMAPTLLFKNRGTNPVPVLAIGAPGGTRIIGTVLNGLVNYIDFGMCLADAVAAPRAIARNVSPIQIEQSLYETEPNSIQILTERQFDMEATAAINTFLQAVEIVPLARETDAVEAQLPEGYRYVSVADRFRMEVAKALAY